MHSNKPWFHLEHFSGAYLERAREHLARFDTEGHVPSFFYAALELRFGIEARLNEYLSPALKAIGKNSTDLEEYVASKLLKRLVQANPLASEKCTINIGPGPGGSGVAFQFTPVTPALASMHGQLGELLHYKFFNNNPYWSERKLLKTMGKRSLLDFRELLGRVVDELAEATRGRMMINPTFTEIVRQVLDEPSDEGQAQPEKHEGNSPLDAPPEDTTAHD